MPSTVVTDPTSPVAERPGPGRPYQVALGVAATAAVAGLWHAGRHWRTPGAAGDLDRLRVVASAVGAVWLIVVLAAPYASTWSASARRRWRQALLVVGAGTVLAVAVAAGRLGAVLADRTPLVDVRATWAAWLAPVALVVVLALAGRLVPRRPARVGLAAGAAAVLLGGAVGAVVSGPGDRIDDGEITADVSGPPGGRLGRGTITGRAAAATAVVAVDGGLLLATGDRILAVDDAGRWFPYLTADQATPDGYGGHVAGESARDRLDLVRSLFRRGDDVVAAGPDGVVSLPATPADRGRMLVALAAGRTEASLAALRTAGVPIVTEGSSVLGAGPDGRGGMFVATEVGVTRVAGDGTVTFLPASGAAFDVDRAEAARVYNVVVQGRADGSGLLAVGCAWYEMAADGSLTPGPGAGLRASRCSPLWPVAVGLDAQGGVALVDDLFERWYAPGKPTGSIVPALPAGRGVVTAEGDHVVAVLGDGRVLRIAERSPTTVDG